MFTWLDAYETWFYSTQDYLFECAWRFGCGIKAWVRYGGWHTFIAFIVFMACFLALKWLWERWCVWLNKFGDGGNKE